MSKFKSIFLDIETGGIDASNSSILSLAAGNPESPSNYFARPIPGSFLSRFSRENIIPQLRGSPGSRPNLINERAAITNLLTLLEKDKAPISGYNIEGFDLGFIQRRSRIYGLENRFSKAIKGREIHDIANPVKDILSREIYNHTLQGHFSSELEGLSWSDATNKWGELHYSKRPEAFNLLKQIEGYRTTQKDTALFKGWKLEDTYNLLGEKLQSGKAHEAASDLLMTERLSAAISSGEFESRLKSGDAATQWLNITKSRGFHKFSEGEVLTRQSIGEMGLMPKLLTKKRALIGAGIAVGSLIGLSMFSGRDDDYNTIEGLGHGGFAQSGRLKLTEFGSGWQGIKIDPRITEFRDNVWSDPEQRAGIRQRIKEEEAKTLAGLGSLEKPDTSIVKAVFDSASSKYAIKVNTDNFNISAEDADTLVLKRKGMFNLLSDPIQVRMAGIDAPEVGGHAGDPLAEIRFAQEQPMGEQAASRLQELIDGAKNLSLYISGEKTYGRYVGALTVNEESAAETLVSEGLVSALPFGKQEADLVSRKKMEKIQIEAQDEQRGMWAMQRYQAIAIANQQLEAPVTYNTLTRLDKLAGSDTLSAYTSLLESVGSDTGPLSIEKSSQAASVGRSLANFFRARMSGKDDAHNTIEGLGHKGVAPELRKKNTEFGSGWRESSENNKEESDSKSSNFFQKAMGMIGLSSLENSRQNLILSRDYFRGWKDFYHGTNLSNRESILKSGIRPNTEDLKKMNDFAGYISPMQRAQIEEKAHRVFFSGMPSISRIHASSNFLKGEGPTLQNMSKLGGLLGYFHPSVRTGKGEGIIFKFRLGMDEVTPQSGIAKQGEAIARTTLKASESTAEKIGKGISIQQQIFGLNAAPNIDLSYKGTIDPSLFNEEIPTRGGKVLFEEAKLLNPVSSKKYKPMLKQGFSRLAMGLLPIALTAWGLAPFFTSSDAAKQRVPSSRAAHNTIEGMGHGGEAEKMRHELTPFSSAWDAARNLLKPGEVFEDVLKSTEFQSALKNSSMVKILGEGGMGEAYLMKASFRGQDLPFVRKMGIVGKEEVSTMQKFQHDFAPSVYSHGETPFGNYIDMEQIQGKTFKELESTGGITDKIVDEYESNLKKMHAAGVVHGDAHSSNVLLTPEGKVGIIDYGTSGRKNQEFFFSHSAEAGSIRPGGEVGRRLRERRLGTPIPREVAIQLGHNTKDIDRETGNLYGVYILRKQEMDEVAIQIMRDRQRIVPKMPIIEKLDPEELLYSKAAVSPEGNTAIKPLGAKTLTASPKTLTSDPPSMTFGLSMNSREVRSKKLVRSKLQRAASKSSWINGQSGGRRSKT